MVLLGACSPQLASCRARVALWTRPVSGPLQGLKRQGRILLAGSSRRAASEVRHCWVAVLLGGICLTVQGCFERGAGKCTINAVQQEAIRAGACGFQRELVFQLFEGPSGVPFHRFRLGLVGMQSLSI
jgi:hypothetical protein